MGTYRTITLSKLGRKRSEKKTQLVRLGVREVETLGLSQGFWGDLYHRSMNVSWPVFFGSAAALFVALNAVFGFLYSLGHEPIANAAQNGALAYFYFSIETLATVGYGDMHPQTNYGHLIATIEIFTGMSFLAVMTGLIFARFSRPRARFEFANKAVITSHEGQRTLMIRIANMRHNAISRANARLWIIRVERTKDGEQFRRFHELKLDRSDHPIFPTRPCTSPSRGRSGNTPASPPPRSQRLLPAQSRRWPKGAIDRIRSAPPTAAMTRTIPASRATSVWQVSRSIRSRT